MASYAIYNANSFDMTSEFFGQRASGMGFCRLLT